MNALTITERGGIWSLRPQGAVFPILEASPRDVVDYVKQNFTGRGLVEVYRENGGVERLKVSALTA
jgi:hypothetical protein